MHQALTRAAIVPELYVTDLERSLRFYVDVLGFEVDYRRPTPKFASVRLGAGQLMLEELAELGTSTAEDFEAGHWRTGTLEYPFGRGVSFEISVPDVASLHARVLQSGYTAVLGVRDRSYRVGRGVVKLRQFLVMDPDGYLMRLAQQL